jgi:hypothetical protein
MKFSLTCLLAAALLCGVLSAQEYKGRAPKAAETRRVAGLTDYIQDGPRANFTMYLPAEGEAYTLRATNNVVTFRSVGALTNFVINLPLASTSARQAFLINCNGNVSAELLPIGAYVITTATNVTPLASLVTATNCSFWLFNNNRTAWHFVPIH